MDDAAHTVGEELDEDKAPERVWDWLKGFLHRSVGGSLFVGGDGDVETLASRVGSKLQDGRCAIGDAESAGATTDVELSRSDREMPKHTNVLSSVGGGISDIHLLVGARPVVRRGGKIEAAADWVLTEEHMGELVHNLLTADQRTRLREYRACDSSLDLGLGPNAQNSGAAAFRIHCFYQRNTLAMAIRRSPPMTSGCFALQELGIPVDVESALRQPEGLVVVTGPTGSGKSTSMAAMINLINEKRCCRILTVEDPIEFQHENRRSFITQQEIGRDVLGFASAIKSALRQDVDVVMIGEMRDLETIREVLHMAGTGHLVLTTFHASGAVETADQIVSMFPVEERLQVRLTLARVLRVVLAQVLVPRLDGRGRVLVSEYLRLRPTLAKLIAEGEDSAKLRDVLQQDGASGNALDSFGHVRSGYTLLQNLYKRCMEGDVSDEVALESAGNYRNDLGLKLRSLRYGTSDGTRSTAKGAAATR